VTILRMFNTVMLKHNHLHLYSISPS